MVSWKCKSCGKRFVTFKSRIRCPECAEERKKEYHKNYLKNENKQYQQQWHKERREKAKNPTIYIFINKAVKVFYVGSTDILQDRLSVWFSTEWEKLFIYYQLGTVKAVDISGVVRNTKERLYLELLFIRHFNNPSLNTYSPIKHLPSESRQKELQQFFEYALSMFGEVDISRYKQKVTTQKGGDK